MGGHSMKWSVTVLCLALAAMANPSGNCLLLSQNPQGMYVVVADDPSLALGSAFTIAAWVYPINMGEWSGLICKAGAEDEFGDVNCAGFNLQFSGMYTTGQSGQVVTSFYMTRDSTATPKYCATSALTAGQWSHIAFVYNGSTMSLYKNGTLTTTCTGYSGPLQPNTCPLFFGVDIPGTREYYTGAFDDIAIWTRALSAADITAAQAGTFSGLTSAMAGLWRFDEGAGTIVGDTGPLAKNHGTIRGSPVWRGINPANVNTLVAPTPSLVKTSPANAARRDLSWTRRGSDLVLRGPAIGSVRVLNFSGRCVFERRVTRASEVRIPAGALASDVLVSEITFAGGETASVPVLR